MPLSQVEELSALAGVGKSQQLLGGEEGLGRTAHVHPGTQRGPSPAPVDTRKLAGVAATKQGARASPFS